MTLVSNLTTVRRNAILAVVSKIARFAAVLAVILLSSLVLVSAEHYFDPDLRLDAAQEFVSP